MFLLVFSKSFAEGTKQLMPDSTLSAAGLYIDNITASVYTRFALAGCAPNYRLNIHVAQPGERILFGLKAPMAGLIFNLRKPDGTVVLSGSCPYSAGETGFIKYFKQAVTGPFPQNSGYMPLSYTVTNLADTGNYYFEITNAPTYTDVTFDLWDFQVVTGAHDPAIPADTLNGRVWSQSWQLYADLGNIFFQPFNGKFFVYSDDGIVTRLAFDNAHVGAVTIFCNPYGCYNTGNFINDRRSVNTNTFIPFPGIAQYKVFLNNPDTLVYPSGVFGEITGTPGMTGDSSYPPCSPNKLLVVGISKPGVLETTITFTYGAPATTLTFYSLVVSGTNYIPWNGLDGQGNSVPDGTLITVQLNYVNGLTNLPIWDQERNPEGYIISLVRPGGSSVTVPLTYWDDSQLASQGFMCPVAPQTVNLTGCSPGSIPGYDGCHPWGLNQQDCHDKMINTWWYSSASNASFTALFTTTPPNAIGHDSVRCGPGAVLLTASVQPGQTVDWYDSITAGNLLLAGDTSFITPVLMETTTYYAEARDTAGACFSSGRTPVMATIHPMISPEISGPGFICEGAGPQNYTTQAGMLNYHWDVTPGGVINSGQGTNSISVTWAGPGDGKVGVIFINPNGCIPPPATKNVSIGTRPDPAGPVTGPSPLCIGTYGAVYSVAPVAGALTYVWSLPLGLVLVSGHGTNSITVDVPPGSVSGDIIVHALNFCGDGLPSPPFPLIIHQPAEAEAGIGDTLCEGSEFTLNEATAQNYISLQWHTSGQGSFSDPATLNPVYTPSSGESGPVSLTLIAHSFPPCPNDTSVLILFYNMNAYVDAGLSDTTCENISFSLSNSAASGYKSLNWITGGSGTFSDPAILHPTYIPSQEDIQQGMVTLILEAFPESPCLPVTDSMQLYIGRYPTATAGTGGSVCDINPFRVTDASAVNYSHILWTHNGEGTLSGDTTLQPEYTPLPGETGEITLTMRVRGISSCDDPPVTGHVVIKVYSGISADAGPDQVIDDSTSTFLYGTAQGGSGDYIYSWEPAALLINPEDLNPQTRILTSGTIFTLFVKDHLSICSGMDSVLVKVKSDPPEPADDCIVLHNVITPNGDGLNDRFIIDCIEHYPENSIRFFTRWGTQVRSFDGYDNVTMVWDGTNSKGEALPDGTYYFILTGKNIDPRTGWVYIRDSSR